MFILKRFKIMEVVKICMPKKNGSNVLLKNRILEPKENLRMKDEEIEIIWK